MTELHPKRNHYFIDGFSDFGSVDQGMDNFMMTVPLPQAVLSLIYLFFYFFSNFQNFAQIIHAILLQQTP